jgi:hypothetical protein
MIDPLAWYAHRHDDVSAQRAVAAWERIQDNASSITILRGSTNLSAQTVRVELVREGQDRPGEAGQAGVWRVMVFGVRDHPTETDTDIAKGDRFIYGGSEYRVIAVSALPGEVQATAERVT